MATKTHADQVREAQARETRRQALQAEREDLESKLALDQRGRTVEEVARRESSDSLVIERRKRLAAIEAEQRAL
jgi:hypothetical protein